MKIDLHGLRPVRGAGQLMGVYGTFCSIEAQRQYNHTEAEKKRVKDGLGDCEKVYWSRCARETIWLNNTKCVTNITITFYKSPIINVHSTGNGLNHIACESGVLIGEKTVCCIPE